MTKFSENSYTVVEWQCLKCLVFSCSAILSTNLGIWIPFRKIVNLTYKRIKHQNIKHKIHSFIRSYIRHLAAKLLHVRKYCKWMHSSASDEWRCVLLWTERNFGRTEAMFKIYNGCAPSYMISSRTNMKMYPVITHEIKTHTLNLDAMEAY